MALRLSISMAGTQQCSWYHTYAPGAGRLQERSTLLCLPVSICVWFSLLPREQSKTQHKQATLEQDSSSLGNVSRAHKIDSKQSTLPPALFSFAWSLLVTTVIVEGVWTVSFSSSEPGRRSKLLDLAWGVVDQTWSSQDSIWHSCRVLALQVAVSCALAQC